MLLELVISASLMLPSGTPPAADDVWFRGFKGGGRMPCSQFLGYVNDTGQRQLLAQWAYGFVTGYNYGAAGTRTYMIEIPDDIIERLVPICRANPDISVHRVLDAYVEELEGRVRDSEL